MSLIDIPVTVFDSSLPTQMYSGSFIRKNPMMFVDTTWVKINKLREFILREQDSEVNTRKTFFLIFSELMNIYRNMYATNTFPTRQRQSNKNTPRSIHERQYFNFLIF